jgi:hypothetical protein
MKKKRGVFDSGMTQENVHQETNQTDVSGSQRLTNFCVKSQSFPFGKKESKIVSID